MKKFEIKKILIPIDFSETSMLAIEHAGFMAKMFKAELMLLHVLEENWSSFSIVVPEISIDAPSDITDKIRRRLAELAEKTRHQYGVNVSSFSTSGNICNEIVNISKDQHADIVVMGTHGASGFEEFFIGSNAYKVVTKSECPVLSVQTDIKQFGFNNIILPIDNSDHSRQKVNHAAVLAKHYASKIHVLGLLNEDDDADMEHKFNVKLSQVHSYFEKSEISYSSKTIKGKNQATLTLGYADSINADLVVIMTDQDSEGSFLSSYAQQIVNHSKIPVLSITPEEHPENIPWIHPY